MKATTFQQILSQFLEEESPVSREESHKKAEFKPQFTSYEALFNWDSPLKAAPKKFSYPPPAPRAQVKANVESQAKPVPTPSEPSWLIEKLSPEDQAKITILTRMGANFPARISISRLKKAHRRLAKQLHPDLAKERGEDFLRLQSIYEELSRSLTKLSESACDSESASAQESQHRAAS